MKVQISATAPTSYQTASLRQFGMGCKPNGNGSYSAAMAFDTMKEAKNYLTSRAEYYFESAKELKEAKRGIRLYGMLRLDAVSASIEKIENY
jgi:hypothetical protein